MSEPTEKDCSPTQTEKPLTVRQWDVPPIVPDDRKMTSDWRPVGDEWTVRRTVATLINGFGRPIESTDILIRRRVERRAVWEFVGYEERIADS